MSLSVVLKDDALYSTVSFFIIIGLPVAVTLAASSSLVSGDISTSPRLMASFTVISFVYSL